MATTDWLAKFRETKQRFETKRRGNSAQATPTGNTQPAVSPQASAATPAPLGKVGRHGASCPTCGDTWQWPTSRGGWVCSLCSCAAPGGVQIATPDRDILEAGAGGQPEWIRERDMSPESVAEAFRRYVAEAHGGQMPDLPHGTLLSRFNKWLAARGRKATTLPVLCQVLGTPAARAENPLAYVKRCERCGSTEWGPSGRHAEDGAEIWCCRTCAHMATRSH
jgi:hypothetical protein